MSNKKLPLLRGVITGYFNAGDGTRQAHLEVLCPFCGFRHLHGWLPGNNRPEHRYSHCGNESPFAAGGYYIQPFRKCDPESAAHVRDTFAKGGIS